MASKKMTETEKRKNYISKLYEMNSNYEFVSGDFSCKRLNVTIRCKICGYTMTHRSDYFFRFKKECPNCTVTKKFSKQQWQKGYQYARRYYEKYHNLLPHSQYVDESGYRLGTWICNQRSDYKKHKLDNKKIADLESIGMVWDKTDYLWKEKFIKIKEYYLNNGSLYPLTKLSKELGEKYLHWIYAQTSKYREGKLSKEYTLLLEDIGIRWNKLDTQWEEMFYQAKRYYDEFCNNGKLVFTGNESSKLHRWIRSQRDNYKTGSNSAFTEARINLLNSIGMIWDEYEYFWQEMYVYAQKYFSVHKHLSPTIEEDHVFFTWIRTQRKAYQHAKLPSYKIELLENIGMVWDDSNKVIRVSFPEKAISYFLMGYYSDIETSNRTILDGLELDIYIPEIRTAIEYDGFYHINTYYKDNQKNILCNTKGIKLFRIRELQLPRLNRCDSVTVIVRKSNDISSLAECITKLLKMLGHEVLVTADEIENSKQLIINTVNNYNTFFEKMFQKAEKFYTENGHLFIAKDYDLQLYRWIVAMRLKKRNREMSSAVIKRFNRIGMSWNPLDDTWINNYNIAREYFLCSGNLKIERNTVINNVKIGNWIKYQRDAYACGRLSDDKIRLLNDIHMIWRVMDRPTEKKYFAKIKFNLLEDGVVFEEKHNYISEFPDLLNDWDFQKNIVKPNEVSIGSHQMIWWKCSKCSYEWPAEIRKRTILKRGCPRCRKNKTPQ